MTIQFKIKRGTTSNVSGITPAVGEFVLDTTTGYLYIGDGTHTVSQLIPINQDSGNIEIMYGE